VLRWGAHERAANLTAIGSDVVADDNWIVWGVEAVFICGFLVRYKRGKSRTRDIRKSGVLPPVNAAIGSPFGHAIATKKRSPQFVGVSGRRIEMLLLAVEFRLVVGTEAANNPHHGVETVVGRVRHWDESGNVLDD
jgi:hypothetical protein